jgi:hypothetical protein
MTVTENPNNLKDGRVVAIAGPVVDVEFPRGSLPEINTALEMIIVRRLRREIEEKKLHRAELTHMSPEDRRIFIEELVGLQKFDDEKNAALKELEKADQDLVKFEAIFQEVARQLKAVEKEKNYALRWMELDNKIKEHNARLISLGIKKLRDEEDQVGIFIIETKKKIEEITEDITGTQNSID